jgi:hypothetical protein
MTTDRLKEYIYDRLDEDAPTAAMFWTGSDFELGTKEGWSIECKTPTEVHDQLVQDILAGIANEIRIYITWVGGLVEDKHAPPSIATTWGLFKTDADSCPEALHGHTKTLNWALTTSDISLSEDENGKEVEDEDEKPNISPDTGVIVNNLQMVTLTLQGL